ncbi:MAG TPA: outer membrane beta-barrel protein [Candidatus Rubrimentiphilum sp.]|nr:outer membrane beta-barrel protein [Candidatus Rubrimentiphilum sp.]
MVRFLTRSLFAMLAAAAFAVPALADPVPPPTPSPTPSPPPITVTGIVSGFTFTSDNPNATGALDTASGADLSSRTQISNALITVAHSGGPLRFLLTAGAYNFPVAGLAINPTFQKLANTNLYGYLPNAYVQYVPNANWTISAGKLPTLLGQENAFTFQNADIQRGLVWNMEPVVSNGVRVAYSNAGFSAALEYNDGFYSGNHRAFEGLLGWNLTPASSVQFIFIIPDANTPSNNTVLIANKREYDLMYTQQVGKLQLLPYALWVQSPSSSALGYANSQRAFGAVMIASYAFNGALSLGGRFEAVGNSSSVHDFSFNSDLVGYGPGSSATTFTLTPAYKTAHFIARGEWSYVVGNNVLPSLGFGPAGLRTNQTRFGLEVGTQF